MCGLLTSSYFVLGLKNFSSYLLFFFFYITQMTPKCASLALQHYMLKPIQRIPQYRLLLQGLGPVFYQRIFVFDSSKYHCVLSAMCEQWCKSPLTIKGLQTLGCRVLSKKCLGLVFSHVIFEFHLVNLSHNNSCQLWMVGLWLWLFLRI